MTLCVVVVCHAPTPRNTLTLLFLFGIWHTSFTTWPFCLKAKAILDAKIPQQYTVVELDQDVDGKAIRAVMGDLLGRTSVPAIWINGTFIGGCNDGGPMGGGIVQLDASGELDVMIKAAMS